MGDDCHPQKGKSMSMSSKTSNGGTEDGLRIQESEIYKEFLAEREEVMRHKWFESEKNGYDIGFERALTDWRVKHRSKWLADRRRKRQKASHNVEL